MKSFNVFGCCVSRDALAVLDAQKKACVQQCVGGTTTVSVFSDKLCHTHTYTIDDFKEYKGSNYFKRLVCQDINKTAIDYLFERKSDFLIIDLLANRLNMFRKGDFYLTESAIYRSNKEKFTEDFNLEEYEEIKMTNQALGFYKDSLDKLCGVILRNYSPDQIILNECYGVLSYISNMRKKSFDAGVRNHVESYNKLVREMYSYVKSKLKGCHIINFIDNVLADPANKWGLYPLHYHSFYYEYDAKAIETVCWGGHSQEEEAARLEELRQYYSEKFELLNLQLEMTAKKDSLRWVSNVAKFEKNLLTDMFSGKRFVENILKIKEKGLTVAVLKCTDNAGQILLKALEAYGIEVVFKTQLWEFKWLKEEDFARCRAADLIISANVHEAKAPEERDGVKAILISDLLKEKIE